MKSNRSLKSWLLISASLIVAGIVTVLPLPYWAQWLQADWVFLILVFWMLYAPRYVGIICAWIIGLFLDILMGSLLGLHALALVSTVYFIVKFGGRLPFYSLLQQSIVIMFLFLFYKLVLLLMHGIVNRVQLTWQSWSAILFILIAWPVVFIALDNCRRRYRVAEAT